MHFVKQFPKLGKFLRHDSARGLYITGGGLIPDKNAAEKVMPLLKHYMVDDSIQATIGHNLRWANGKEEKPRFKFAYVMLPTACNQKCVGCFTGKDKALLPPELDGERYSKKTIDEIIGFLKEHEAEAIAYGGGGELFTWKGAFDYIDQITDSGLGFIVFTNGSLLSKKDVERLAQNDVSILISLRDTVENKHNTDVGINGFRKTLQALEYALQQGMHKENRLAVEIPVTRENEERVLFDFIPVMRTLGAIPFAEEYIQTMTSVEEKKVGHTFSEARRFFEMAAKIDERMGYVHKLEFGQRMQAQPKCERTLYSFAVYPSGDVMPCPGSSFSYGNFYKLGLKQTIYSERFRLALKKFRLCPCSVFYTKSNESIPEKLPEHLECFR